MSSGSWPLIDFLNDILFPVWAIWWGSKFQLVLLLFPFKLCLNCNEATIALSTDHRKLSVHFAIMLIVVAFIRHTCHFIGWKCFSGPFSSFLIKRPSFVSTVSEKASTCSAIRVHLFPRLHLSVSLVTSNGLGRKATVKRWKIKIKGTFILLINVGAVPTKSFFLGGRMDKTPKRQWALWVLTCSSRRLTERETNNNKNPPGWCHRTLCTYAHAKPRS